MKYMHFHLVLKCTASGPILVWKFLRLPAAQKLGKPRPFAKGGSTISIPRSRGTL